MIATMPLARTKTTILAICLLGATARCQSGFADDGSDVWLVNTRQASHCGALEGEREKLVFQRGEDACRWSISNRAEFLSATAGGVPLVVFVHGNRTDNAWAVDEAMDVYPYLKRAACGKPFRFLIWSWPSDIAVRHYRPDVQVKNVRSDADAFYLADLLAECDPQTPISLTGYSLGARVIGGGMHLLGGGSVAGRSLDDPPQDRAKVRAVLIAAAIDANSFSAQGRFCRATSVAERIVVTVNQNDPALKWYTHLYGRRGPQAIGHAGPAGAACGGVVQSVDLSCCVGHRHRWQFYADCPTLTSLYGPFAFLGDCPAACD